MAKKKNTSLSVSEEENGQAQSLLAHYRQIAEKLHGSTDQKQAEAALTEINTVSEGSQIALIKALSKENQIDAADVLLAIHELSPIKSARKEAKRSLIRLESAKVYPGWQPPVDRSLIPGNLLSMANPPRFWKGFVTDSLDIGEIQLILSWEQGEDYDTVRTLGFLLEFGHEGVKDAFTQVESKRSFEKYMEQIADELDDVSLKDCSLAKGRRLLMEALEVNRKHGTSPHRDYRLSLSLITQLILDAPDLDDEVLLDEDYDEDEDEETTIDISGLSPLSIISNFVNFHVTGNYEVAYDLLAQNSTLREGLTKEEWVVRRKDWEQKANPGDLEPGFLAERAQTKPRLWVPKARNTDLSTKEIDASWSITLEPEYPSDSLPELLEATASYEETGRRWFWASFTLVQEEDEWRIQSLADEGKKAQNLSPEELQKQIQTLSKHVEKSMKKYTPDEIVQLEETKMETYIGDVIKDINQIIYYTGALLKKLPLKRDLYTDAVSYATTFGQFELSLVYLLPLIQRFPEEHGPLLRQVAMIERKLSVKYVENNDEELAERFEKLAETALRESLAIEDSFEAHISLAELLIDENERLDEAQDHLLQAKTMTSEPDEEAHVEMHLGEIAMEQELLQEALGHYQRVVQLVPDGAEGWSDLGNAYKRLEQIEEATTSYQRAIELNPEDDEYYYELSRTYADNGQIEKAIDLLQDALVINSDSIPLNIYLASLYVENENDRMAEVFLKKAERLDPESGMVALLRQVLDIRKADQSFPSNQPRKLLKQKRKSR